MIRRTTHILIAVIGALLLFASPALADVPPLPASAYNDGVTAPGAASLDRLPAGNLVPGVYAARDWRLLPLKTTRLQVDTSSTHGKSWKPLTASTTGAAWTVGSSRRVSRVKELELVSSPTTAGWRAALLSPTGSRSVIRRR